MFWQDIPATRSNPVAGPGEGKSSDYTNAAQLLDSQFELVFAQPDRAVALFHSVVQSGQRDKIPGSLTL
jgi:hypothetical protein